MDKRFRTTGTTHTTKHLLNDLNGSGVNQRPLLPPPDAPLVEVDERERERAEQHEGGAQVKARLRVV